MFPPKKGKQAYCQERRNAADFGSSEILNDAQQERHTDLIPRLHPVYLPFRTQHQILTMVQSMLEGCCFDFGNSYVPELMEAQKWDEAESVELTQWIQRFSKHAKNLPPPATRAVAGKGLMEALFATSNLRHSAVHRLRTSAAGILKMVDAAVIFAQALKDATRATAIENIKDQLSVVIEDIEQHQTLLERKLSDQLEDLARRRAEIDELERQAVEDMLSNDMSHRYTAGSAVEDFLIVLQASHTCTPAKTTEQVDGNADPESEMDAKTIDEGMLHSVAILASYRSLTRLHVEENCSVQDYQNKDDDHPDLEVIAEDQEIPTAAYADEGNQTHLQTANAESAMFSLATVERGKYPDRPTLPEKHGSKAKRGYTGSWFFDEIAPTMEDCDRPHSAADEALSMEHNSPNGDFISLVAVEHHLTNEEKDPTEDAAGAEALALEEAPSIERDARVADSLDPDCAVAEDADSYTTQMARVDEALLEAEMAADYNYSLSPLAAEQSPEPPLEQGLGKVSELPPRTSSGPLQSASVSDRPDESHAAEKYMIVMNILDGPNRFTSMVCLDSTTKTAILNEAQTACQRRVAQVKEEQTEGKITYDSQLVSVRVDGFEVDLSTYDAEDLTFLIQTISNTSIPTFTVKVWRPPQL
jgi:hypothetical protein